jgi:hypothetical protein
MSDTVKLGYEISSDHDQAHEVCIPIRHMVVAGQTQEAGKTTTLEALIERSGKTAIAFVTKRGEGSFAGGRRVQPYFRERADWQFVASILEATMRERMKFERSWIINASKGARSLADVHANVKKALKTARGISEGVYTTLDAYLDIVVPRIARVDWAPALELRPGINVVDVSDRATFPPELQGLVMRSVLEAVYESFEDVITIIPEAWEFIPQGRGSPVKLAAVELIRKGAGLRNFVWLDSQDIGGVDKEILRSCPVWLLGVQREANEIKRVLGNIPDGISKPKPGAIATLERGQFFACYGRHAIKTYVQPAWIHDVDAQCIARGLYDASVISRLARRPPLTVSIHASPDAPPATERALEELASAAARQLPYRDLIDFPSDEDDLMSSEAIKKLANIEQLLERLIGSNTKLEKISSEINTAAGPIDEEQLFERFRARLLKDPAVLRILATQPVLEISTTVERIEIDGKTLRGRLALMIQDGHFDVPRKANAAFEDLKRRGFSTAKPNVYKECDRLAELGFLTNESEGYQVVAGMKKNLVRK